MISEDIEMTPLPREEDDQEIETGNEIEEIEEMSPHPRDEAALEMETENERIVDIDEELKKKIKDYFDSFQSKSFIETLQFQKENFIEFPASEENIHPLTLEKRTRKDTIIALVLFFMR